MLTELRQIPEITHAIDTVQLIRSLGLHYIDKSDCSFIWRWRSDVIPKVKVINNVYLRLHFSLT